MADIPNHGLADRGAIWVDRLPNEVRLDRLFRSERAEHDLNEHNDRRWTSRVNLRNNLLACFAIAETTMVSNLLAGNTGVPRDDMSEMAVEDEHWLHLSKSSSSIMSLRHLGPMSDGAKPALFMLAYDWKPIELIR
jgi:hypothetical protein